MNADELRRVPLLAHFDDEVREAVAAAATTVPFAKGDVLWRAGDEGDVLLIVESGELEALGPDGEAIGRAGPGDCMGELALLLDERRSATVVCRVAGRALSLDRNAFRDIVRDHRALAMLSAIAARRAVDSTLARRAEHRLLVVGVVADPGVPGASLVARLLVDGARALLGRRAELVDAGADVDDAARAARSSHAGAHLCVLDVGAGVELARVRAGCDLVVRVTHDAAVDARADVVTVVNERGRSGGPLPINATSPYVVADDDSIPAVGAPAIDRLVRKLFGVTVGLALGGGAAFGIAHVGVLQALERSGIEVDLFAGTSFGSIVALGAAGGLSGDEMEAIARRIGNVRTVVSVLDPAVDGSGLLAGRRLVRIFSPLVGAESFAELRKPCRVVATDIESGDRVDIGTGRLDDAFRASCSIPLVFSPVVAGGRTLVDGAMTDPVPAEVVRSMGADIVVGVNVVPRLDKGSSTAISRAVRTVNRLNPLSYRRGSRGLPDVVDVLMNSLQVVQHELGRFRSLAGDAQVDVDLAGFTWIDFHRAVDIIERGRAAGELVVPQVQRLIDDRLV